MPNASPPSLIEYLLQHIDNGVIIANPEKIVTHINPAAASMLGESITHFLNIDANKAFVKFPAIINMMNREDPVVLTVHMPRRKLATGIANTLETRERIVVLQDITERHEIELQREQLVNQISHDMRNPISAINGFIELVEKFGPLNTIQHRYLLRGQQTTMKLHDMIEQLIELAWIEAGMPLQHLPIRIGDILKKAIANLSSLAQQKDIRIVSALQDPLPVISGDPDRIYMAVYHLLRNAIQYSDPTQSIAIHAWGDDNDLYCSVGDQGIGIAENEIEAIFERMYRSRNEHVQKTDGGGIGLTLTRTIIKRHGGEIWVISMINSGSTFTFRIPIIQI
ncbi:hypothetical protein MASR2M15_09190 [Anaerolineales bacterium]